MSLILPAFSSPELKVFPLCSKSSKSSEGGQGETVSSVSAFFQSSLRSSFQEAVTPATDSPDARIIVVAFVVLNDCCTCGGSTLISRLNLCPSATCRARTGLPLWHLSSVSASASRTRKPPPNTIGQHTFARLGLITSAPSSPARRQCITDIFILKVYDGTHVILLLCFLCV